MSTGKRFYFHVPANRLKEVKETVVNNINGQATLYRKWRWSEGMGVLGEIYACGAWHLRVDQAAYNRWLADPDAFYELHLETDEDEVYVMMWSENLDYTEK